MLTTFTTEDGILVIRAEDLRVIEDVEHTPPRETPACLVRWLPDGKDLMSRLVLGTATENRDRIMAEEVKMLAAYEEMQHRAQRGMPALPIVRGGKVAPR